MAQLSWWTALVLLATISLLIEVKPAIGVVAASVPGMDDLSNLRAAGKLLPPASARSGDGVKTKDTPVILNGQEVTDRTKFPFMTFLICFGNFNLNFGPTVSTNVSGSGALITNRFILTSALFLAPISWMGPVNKTVRDVTVTYCDVIMGGVTNASNDEPGEVTMRSYDIRPDSQWESSTKPHGHQLGLIKLPQAVAFSNYIKPISLPPANSNHEGAAVWLLGWGATETGWESGLLRAARSTMTTDAYCKYNWYCPSFPYYGDETNCYGGDGQTGTCVGPDGIVAKEDGLGGYVLVSIAVSSKYASTPVGPPCRCPELTSLTPDISYCFQTTTTARTGVTSGGGGGGGSLSTNQATASTQDTSGANTNGAKNFLRVTTSALWNWLLQWLRSSGSGRQARRETVNLQGHEHISADEFRYRGFQPDELISPARHGRATSLSCSINVPSLGAKVSKYITWINQNMY